MAKKALCVGINNFKNYPNSSLQGCVNDADAMVALLKKWMGFKSDDIIKLTDALATKENIMKNLKLMVDGAKQGKYSYLVFSMSSHGTQVPDTNDEEPDRADEAFCPYDLKSAGGLWDSKYIITDDELNELFTRLPANVLLEVYLDTCHSGTGLKSMDLLADRRPRWMPPPSYKAFEDLESRYSYGLKEKFFAKDNVHHILWAGCRANQTSSDAYIAKGWHGAFTYYFCNVMNATKNKLSRKDVLTKVRAKLKTGHYSQVPQLECEATLRNAPIV
jgi:hypothetical protein